MHRKIWIGLSAALIAFRLSAPAEAALTGSQLDIIEEYVTSGNWAKLRQFLLENPSLWAGSDPLSLEFRRFLDNTASLYTALTFQQSMFPALADAQILPDPAPPAPVRAQPIQSAARTY